MMRLGPGMFAAKPGAPTSQALRQARRSDQAQQRGRSDEVGTGTTLADTLRVEDFGVVTESGFTTTRVSFHCSPGQLVVIHGRLGAGKSLICEALSGIARPGCESIGSVRWPGDESSSRLAVVPQDARLAALPTDRVRVLLRQRTRGEASPIDILERLGMSRERTLPMRFRELSSSERSKVLWAAALARSAQTLLVDGFAETLDERDRALVMAEMNRQLSAGRRVILTTRQPDLLDPPAHWLVDLDEPGQDSVVPLVGKPRRPPPVRALEVQALRVPRGRAGLFGRRRAAYPVDGATLHVRRGECLVLLGPAGSGKTTLVETLAGLHLASDGRVVALGRSYDARRGMRSAALRRKVQLVFQEAPLVLDARRTVRAHLREAARLATGPQGSAAAWLERLGLSPRLLDLQAGYLSTGEAQRVDLARSLVLEPEVVLLDEPRNAAVDADQGMLAAFIQSQKSRGIAFVVATSSLDVAKSLGDRIAFLLSGRVVEMGPAQDLVDRPAHPALRDYRNASFAAPSDPRTRHSGCPYVSVCERAIAPDCHQTPPTVTSIGARGRRQVACLAPLAPFDARPG